MTAAFGPVAASVLFLRMRGFADAPAAERAIRRDRLDALVREALPAWEAGRRVVLEAPDGLALVGDVEPAAALEAARLVAEQADPGTLGIALHHGPVRVVSDNDGETRLVGDGIATAGALAGFTASHPVVASHAFREALALRAPRRADDLRSAGEQVDERLRSHQLFVLDPEPARALAVRRNVLGAAGLVLLLGTGWAGRVALDRYEQAHRPATIVLDIHPGGDVFVDDQPKGRAPPLTRVSLPPGAHTIEVRNGRAKPVRMEVNLQPGEELQVRHTFAPPPATRRARPPQGRPQQERGLLDRFRFW